MDYDVIICGYGPTGAVAANLLGQRGLRTLVVDQSEEIYDIPRAIHFDGEIMRIFQSIGLSDEIKTMSGTAEALAFLNGRGRTLISAHAADFAPRHGWPTGNFFNQPRLEARLRAGVARFPSVEVRLGVELTGFEQDEASVRVAIRRTGDGAPESVSARYLLGCDGASSPVREIAGLPLEDLGCDEPWLVVDWILDEGVPYRTTIYQFCDPRRPATLVPSEGRHIRWEFMMNPGEDPDELERKENVHALMAPYLPLLNDDLRPDQGRLIRKKVYRFHGLVAERFQDRRAFVLGDAAHQTPPFLGQGLCAGVRDAYNLCWRLHGVLAGCLSPEVLDSYSTERRPHARAVVSQAIRTGRVTSACIGRSINISSCCCQHRLPPARDGALALPARRINNRPLRRTSTLPGPFRCPKTPLRMDDRSCRGVLEFRVALSRGLFCLLQCRWDVERASSVRSSTDRAMMESSRTLILRFTRLGSIS